MASTSRCTTREDETKEEEDPDPLPPVQTPVLIALSYSGARLGAAVYNLSQKALLLMPDTLEDSDFGLVKSLLEQCGGTMIVLSKAQDVALQRLIAQHCGVKLAYEDYGDQPTNNRTMASGAVSLSSTKDEPAEGQGEEVEDMDDEEEEEDEGCEMHIMSSAAFKLENAKKRLAELFGENSLSETEFDITLQMRVDTRNINMIRASGALLRYMDSMRTGVEHEALNVRTPITRVKTITVEKIVEMDASTRRSLDIFCVGKKADCGWRAVVNGSAINRISLFGICNRCKSPAGTSMLRKWFARPTQCLTVLKQRQRAVSFFSQEANLDVTGALLRHLPSVKNIKSVLLRMRGGCKVSDWRAIYESTVATTMVGRILRTKQVRLSMLAEQAPHAFNPDIEQLVDVIGKMIDFEKSHDEQRIVIKAGMDPVLDEKRHQLSLLPSVLTETARAEQRRLRASACSASYMPMIGFILALPPTYPVDRNPELEVLFRTAHNVQVRTDMTRDMDARIGDIRLEVHDRETTIGMRLQRMVLRHADWLMHSVRAAAMIDAAISLAVTARQFEWSCPELVEQPVLELVHVNHPLAKLRMQRSDRRFVCNDIMSGGTISKAKIFTGPNACGKSCYLKMVGVAVFLAHVGSFVPASRARIGLVDRILTRMHTLDAICDGMSTFANDLNQVATALRRSSSHSLVIVDEFGKGTMTEVGLSLLASSLNHWLSMGADCPHLFLSTHFHALCQLLRDPHQLLSYHTFSATMTGDRLDFKFRLIRGGVQCSYAANTALAAGVPKPVVQRATEVYRHLLPGHSLCDLKMDIDEREEKKMLAMFDTVADQFINCNMQDMDELMQLIGAILQVYDAPAQEYSDDDEERMSQELDATQLRDPIEDGIESVVDGNGVDGEGGWVEEQPRREQQEQEQELIEEVKEENDSVLVVEQQPAGDVTMYHAPEEEEEEGVPEKRPRLDGGQADTVPTEQSPAGEAQATVAGAAVNTSVTPREEVEMEKQVMEKEQELTLVAQTTPLERRLRGSKDRSGGGSGSGHMLSESSLLRRFSMSVSSDALIPSRYGLSKKNNSSLSVSFSSMADVTLVEQMRREPPVNPPAPRSILRRSRDDDSFANTPIRESEGDRSGAANTIRELQQMWNGAITSEQVVEQGVEKEEEEETVEKEKTMEQEEPMQQAESIQEQREEKQVDL